MTGSTEVYLDCAATTPIDPRVADTVNRFMVNEFGNAGSRTHSFGVRAQQAVSKAREQVATALGVKPAEVVFTSGATESNNIALLGLRQHGLRTGRLHIVTSQIEHKAILEPLRALEDEGFEITRVGCCRSGRIDPEEFTAAVRDDTLLVTLMQVNNETGIIQPIEAVAGRLKHHGCLIHVDAAQSFGKIAGPLQDRRIDLISLSGHKIYGPKGVGALIARRRGYDTPPLNPVSFGGGQERNLRPGTLPVPLVAGLGMACKIAAAEMEQRRQKCESFRQRLSASLRSIEHEKVGDQEHAVSTTMSLRFPGVDSEALMVGLKGIMAISNGSACTATSYEPSHVLLAMGLSPSEAQEVVRISWCHDTPEPDWTKLVGCAQQLLL